MTYIDYLKEHEDYDKFILFLYAIDLKPAEIAEKAQVTRSHVYNVLQRAEDKAADYSEAIEDLFSK